MKNFRRYMTESIEITIIAVVIILIILSLTKTLMFAVVEGKSMEPILQTGDLVVIVKESPKALRTGNVIVYERPDGEFIIHRVIKIVRLGNNLVVVPKGDNNPVPDGEVPSSWIIGEVLEINNDVIKLPGIGYVTLSLKALAGSIIKANA